MTARIRTLAAVLLLLLGGLPRAYADDVLAAAQAFEEGQRAQLRKEYARAAELFEVADHLAPNPVALRSAIRNHQAAGNRARAATLALKGKDRYASDPATTEAADAALAELSPGLARIDVTCSEPCALVLAGRAVSSQPTPALSFFIDPGSYQLEATWPERPPVSEKLEAVAGKTLAVAFTAPSRGVAAQEPAKELPKETHEPPRAGPTMVAETPPPEHKPLPPAVFWVGAAATAVATGAWVWSGLDTLSARDDYVANPTEAAFDDGTSLETRTNVLLGTAAVLGVTTALIGVLATDWNGSGSDQVSWTPVLAPGPTGWQVGVVQAF